jgi:hypothetical protein
MGAPLITFAGSVDGCKIVMGDLKTADSSSFAHEEMKINPKEAIINAIRFIFIIDLIF